MPSASFIKQKKVGRWFEHLVINELRNGGAYVVDLDKERYEVKKQGDFLIKVLENGRWISNAVECKYDEMSEQTGNVRVDLDSINKTWAPLWVYGLPNAGRIDLYSMKLSDLAPFARSHPLKVPTGEFGGLCSLIRKKEFISQPFIHLWKTISTRKELNR
jgi:hypothetical protein